MHTPQGGRFWPNDYAIPSVCPLPEIECRPRSHHRYFSPDIYGTSGSGLAGLRRRRGQAPEQSESLHTGRTVPAVSLIPTRAPPARERSCPPHRTVRTAGQEYLPTDERQLRPPRRPGGAACRRTTTSAVGCLWDDDHGRGQERPVILMQPQRLSVCGLPDRGCGPAMTSAAGRQPQAGHDPRYQNYRPEPGRPDLGQRDPVTETPLSAAGWRLSRQRLRPGPPDPNYGRPDPRQAYPDQGYQQFYGRPDYGPPVTPLRAGRVTSREPAARDYDYGRPRATSATAVSTMTNTRPPAVP